jgi:hypothetical protein
MIRHHTLYFDLKLKQDVLVSQHGIELLLWIICNLTAGEMVRRREGNRNLDNFQEFKGMPGIKCSGNSAFPIIACG